MQKRPLVKYNNEESNDIHPNEASEVLTIYERSEAVEPTVLLKQSEPPALTEQNRG